MKLGKRCTLALFFYCSLFTVLHAQQPQNYVLQTGSGVAPTASAYPNLNLAPGSVVCNNAIVSYAGGTLTQLVNGGNFIFFDCESGLPKSSKDSFKGSQIPLAVVDVQSNSYRSSELRDLRPWAAIRAGSSLLAPVLSGASARIVSINDRFTNPGPVAGWDMSASGQVLRLGGGDTGSDIASIVVPGGATLSGSSGAATLAAAGSNQNVTLTPSGSGYTILNGNVGVGTTSPQDQLHIDASSSGGVGGSMVVMNSAATAAGNSSELLFKDSNAFTSGYNSAKIASILPQSTVLSDLAFYTYSGGPPYTGVERMRITSGGNVGIGATSPALQLDVANAMRSGISAGSGSGTWSINLSLGNVQQFTCTSGTGVTITPSLSPTPLVKAEVLTLIFVQVGSGTACRLSWPNHIWGAMTTAQVSTLGSVTVQQFVVSNNGTDLYAASPVQSNTGGMP